MQLAEPGLGELQPGEHFERLGNALQAPLTGRGDEHEITVFRGVRQDGLGDPEGLRMAPFRLKPPQPGDLLFHSGRR